MHNKGVKILISLYNFLVSMGSLNCVCFHSIHLLINRLSCSGTEPTTHHLLGMCYHLATIVVDEKYYKSSSIDELLSVEIQ